MDYKVFLQNEIDSLINFFFEKKLDDAIEKVERNNGYTATVYEQWLNAINESDQK